MKEFYRIMRKRNRARIGWLFLLAFAAFVTAGGLSYAWILMGAFSATAIRAQEYIDIGARRGYQRKKKFSLIKMRLESAFWYLDNGTTLGDVMRMHSFVPGEYRDTFTIDTDPSHNEGIIKPIKVGRPAAVASDGGLGAPGMLRTHPGAAPGSEATKGPHLGQVEQAMCSWIL